MVFMCWYSYFYDLKVHVLYYDILGKKNLIEHIINVFLTMTSDVF